MTSDSAKEFDLDLSFLKEGSYQAEIMEDGVNAAKVARDYHRTLSQVKAVDTLKIHMVAGGGRAAILKPEICTLKTLLQFILTCLQSRRSRKVPSQGFRKPL